MSPAIQPIPNESFPSPGFSESKPVERSPIQTVSTESRSSAHREHQARSPLNHERLDKAPPACPSGNAVSGDRGHRPHDPRDAPDREGEVRKSPSGENICRSLDSGTRLDPLVHGPLPGEQGCGTQEGDSVHQAQDRGDRGWRGRSPTASSGETQSQARPEDLGGFGKESPSSSPRCMPRRADQCRSEQLGSSNDQPRACTASDSGSPDAQCARRSGAIDHDRRPPGAPSGIRMGGPMGSMRFSEDDRNWALMAGEIDQFTESQSNQERKYFQNLVSMMEKELQDIEANTKIMGSPIDVVEVFCSPESTLTEQVNHLGGKAIRFGLNQGNLQSAEGRNKLFGIVCRHRPKHVWVSPTCKPWSKWSFLNSQKSLELWDRIQAERRDMLSQVALCLVLFRHQHRCQRHAHWEQPKGSMMFLLPYLSELDRYTLSAKPDMCIAGGLEDPLNKKPMKKGMHIRTTSKQMHQLLDPLKCPGLHEHQPIEGSTQVHGHGIARSEFSERYPRKFARLVAKGILKRSFPKEAPVGSIADQALIAIDQWFQISSAFAVESRLTKKARLSQPRQHKSESADRSLEDQPSGKRRKFKGTSQIQIPPKDLSVGDNETQKGLTEILKSVESALPRVGKRVIDQPQVLQKIQEIFPEKIIKGVIACKGTERTMAPPKDISPREAPFRRSIMKLRSTGKIITDEWEQ